MNRQNFLFLFVGLFAGIIGTAIYCESTREDQFNYGENILTEGISLEQARTLRDNYRTAFPEDNIQGYNISVQQFKAIDSTITKTLSSDLRKTSGFRLYKGLATKDTISAKSFIVYPIDNNLNIQSPSRVFYSTGFDDKYVLPCPKFCD